MTSILMLDAAGTPQEWISRQDASLYITKDLVSWSIGETCLVMRGGINASTGRESRLELPPIIAIKGAVHSARAYKPLPCTRPLLFRRDRHLCAYCGQQYREGELTADHVHPQSRGGGWSFNNLVTSCSSCNQKKDCRTPEEARMPLLYVPYTPNRHETFILASRNILACQMEFLLSGVAANSRLRTPIAYN